VRAKKRYILRANRARGFAEMAHALKIERTAEEDSWNQIESDRARYALWDLLLADAISSITIFKVAQEIGVFTIFSRPSGWPNTSDCLHCLISAFPQTNKVGRSNRR
jgi:hypothetical protein